MKISRLNKNYRQACSLEIALDIIGSKWKGMILYHLAGGVKRFNELRKFMPRASQRMITLQLRELEKFEVIIRTVYPEVPPKVEYQLSPLGLELVATLQSLSAWGEQARETYYQVMNQEFAEK